MRPPRRKERHERTKGELRHLTIRQGSVPMPVCLHKWATGEIALPSAERTWLHSMKTLKKELLLALLATLLGKGRTQDDLQTGGVWDPTVWR
jgi:hypothetical protein